MSDNNKPEDKATFQGQQEKKKNDSGMSDTEFEDIVDMLKSHPKYTTCPYCKADDITNVTRKANLLNGVFCYFCVGYWLCYMMFKKRDINCWDASHTCQKCSKEIVPYSAC